MFRNIVFLFLGAIFCRGATEQHDVLDAAFDKVPFTQWLSEGSQTHFHWTVRIPRVELSFHQRLRASIEITLDGADLQNRRNDGRMVFLTQITDSHGRRFQNHDSIELAKLDADIKSANVQTAQSAFVLPGDYEMVNVIFDTATSEHGVLRTKFHVAAPQHEFLIEAWRDLPPVEFIQPGVTPDTWFLPDITGRLEWAAESKPAARLSVILNVAASVPQLGTRRTPSSGLEALLPMLKVLSAAPETVDLLDLARRRAVFHQTEQKDLDWPVLKAALGDANTASIDVHALAERHHDAQFFVNSVRGILRASEKPDVLVVLTTPVAFEGGEDLEPISLEALPAARVIYIRYRPLRRPPAELGPSLGGRGRGRGFGGPMGGVHAPMELVDQLEATLKPLHPKVLDVETPEEMTKALEEVRKALGSF